MSCVLPRPGYLALGSASTVAQVFSINTSEDTTSWTWQAYVFDPADPGVALVVLSVTWDSTTKKGMINHTPANVLARLDAPADPVDSIDGLRFVVRANVGLSAPVRFFAGPAKLFREVA